MKKILLITFSTLIILMIFVNADLGTYAQGDTVSVRANLNATSVNVSIYFPNSSVAINNLVMENLKGDIWNFNFSSTKAIGIYIYDYCNQEGDSCKENNFEITANGLVLNTPQAILYVLGFFGANILFFLTLYFVIMLPWKNGRSDDNKIMSITKVKYLKLGLMPLCYAFFTWILNILIGLSNFLGSSIFSGYFEFIFLTLLNLSYFLLAVWFFIVIIVAKNDSKLWKKLKRGILPNA